MNPKGQISIFIIIGGILILGSAIFLNQNLNEKLYPNEKSLNYNDLEVVQEYINVCLDESSNDALDWSILENGNYKPLTYNYWPDIPILVELDFWTLEHEIKEFNDEELSKSMNLYLNDVFEFCSKNLEDIENVDIEITEKPQFEVERLNDNIRVNVYYPIQIETPTSTIKIEDFTYYIEDIPLSQFENDSKKLNSAILDLANSFYKDGYFTIKNDAEYEGNLDKLKQTINELDSREDLDLTMIDIDENHQMYVFEYSQKWRYSVFAYGLEDKTEESITNS